MTVIVADCIEAMAAMDAASVDAVVTDPPYALPGGFMGKAWDRIDDFQDWCERWAREALRVLKPGGHLLAFGGTRTYHRLTCGIEDAGFGVRDTLCWLYGSGFPKSLDVARTIDKAARGVPQGAADPTSVNHGRYRTQATEGARSDGDRGQGYGAGPGQFMREAGERENRALVPEAAAWQGWGTALKPAHEPIVVARKPLAGTVAANVETFGTGALNVDAGRANGRWPPNVVLDGDAAQVLDEQTRHLREGFTVGRNRDGNAHSGNSVFGPRNADTKDGGYGDSGGASRFFYVAKASSAERNAGLDGFDKGERVFMGSGGRTRVDGQWVETHSVPRQRTNVHPTVKPIDLMRWLVRLVTPPGGLVLDPFAGSGTTGCAAALEGFRFVGVEREAEYAKIAEARIAFWSRRQGADTAKVLEALEDEDAATSSGQIDLFGEAA